MSSRINLFEQMKNFYDLSFHSENDFTTHHISLYMFLLNQNNRSNWSPNFKLSLDLGMYGSKIGSKRTYYNTLNDLCKWGLIKLTKGKNAWKTPIISIIPLSKQRDSVPLCQSVEVQNRTTNEETSRTTIEESTDTSTAPLLIPLQHPNKDIRHKTLKQETEQDDPELIRQAEEALRKLERGEFPK